MKDNCELAKACHLTNPAKQRVGAKEWKSLASKYSLLLFLPAILTSVSIPPAKSLHCSTTIRECEYAATIDRMAKWCRKVMIKVKRVVIVLRTPVHVPGPRAKIELASDSR